MNTLAVLSLAMRSVANRSTTAFLTILTVAMSVALFSSIDTIRQGARAGFESTISGTDLIVGARSGPINLLLYSVFHIGDPTNAISWDSYEAVSSAPDVAWTVPLSLGDSHRGYRVVGTTNGFFDHYRYGNQRPLDFASGGELDGKFTAVVGAAVARDLEYVTGDEVIIAHGLGEVSFIEHHTQPFVITGVLAPTGTPVDRSVYVTLESIDDIHDEDEAASPEADHDHGDETEAHDHEPEQISAFLVGLENRTAVLRLQRQINTYPEEPLTAVMPAVTLVQLWSVIGAAERVLVLVAGLVVLTGLISILTSILTSLNERRREMAILRAVGARPGHIFMLLVSEAALLAFMGAVMGTVLTYGAMGAVGPLLESRYGVVLGGLGPDMGDGLVILAVTGAAVILGMIPAWRAYRNSLADGLSIRV